MRIFKCERDGCEGIIKLGKERKYFVLIFLLIKIRLLVYKVYISYNYKYVY